MCKNLKKIYEIIKKMEIIFRVILKRTVCDHMMN